MGRLKNGCPNCDKDLENNQKFCTYCGTQLSEGNETITSSRAPPQSQTTNQRAEVRKNLLEGWEVSPDRINMYEKILSTDPIGDPIITSKCVLDNENGFLIVSDNGFSWRIKMGMRSGLASSGKSKWVRWHDVANIIPKKYGQILVELKIRKKGSLLIDKKGIPKIKKWKLTIRQNKGEQKDHFRQRQPNFNQIMSEIHNKNKVDIDPPTSDSRM